MERRGVGEKEGEVRRSGRRGGVEGEERRRGR